MSLSIYSPDLYVDDTGTTMGRGAFAKRSFAKDEIVEIAPVIILNIAFDELPDLLQNYVFDWTALTHGAPHQQALPLGYGSMYNHDNPANLRYEADNDKKVMRYIAARPIQEGEELTINYNAEGGFSVSEKDYWFNQRDIQPLQSSTRKTDNSIENTAIELSAEKLVENVDPTHHNAIKWAATQTNIYYVKSVSDNPWATTYCLSGLNTRTYLKIFPDHAQDVINKSIKITQHFSSNTPKCISVSQDNQCILFSDHQGRDLQSEDDFIEATQSFALMQLEAQKSSELLNSLDTIDITSSAKLLMDFLSSPSIKQSENHSRVGASYFIGESEAQRYLQLFGSRLYLFESQLELAANLPKTLCHGDLQARNIARKIGGEVVFFDWDDAVAGPAGFCLYGLFSGSTLASILVRQWIDSETPGDLPIARRLLVYVKTLVNAGYCSQTELLNGLIGSMSAGQMRFIASFGNFADDRHKEDCAETIRFFLQDLLDLCDWLTTTEPGLAMVSAKEYFKIGELNRAEKLIQDLLWRDKNHLDGLVFYSQINYELGNFEIADKAANIAFSLAPQSIDTRIALARVCLGRLDFQKCTNLLTEVISIEPDNRQAQELTDRIKAISEIRETANKPHSLPRISLTKQEQHSGQLAPDTLSLVVDLFKQYGVVQIDNMFNLNTIKNLKNEFQIKYAEYINENERSDVLRVGERRFMLTLELDKFFGSEELIAPKRTLSIMQQILGQDYILSAYTAVISLPGNTQQEIHKDHTALFDEHGWGFSTPTFAVQIILPLLELNEDTGTTRIFKKTQQIESENVVVSDFQDPFVPLGSCLLLDYSIAHCGMANRSAEVRPILNLVYSRAWFRDCRNYLVQPPLKFSQEYFDNASEKVQNLLSWWDSRT